MVRSGVNDLFYSDPRYSTSPFPFEGYRRQPQAVLDQSRPTCGILVCGGLSTGAVLFAAQGLKVRVKLSAWAMISIPDTVVVYYNHFLRIATRWFTDPMYP